LALLALAAGLTACATTPAPVAAGTDTVQFGNLTTGEKFGAKVGQSTAEAQRVLIAQGYGYEGVVACAPTTQTLLGCQKSEQYLAFQPVQNGVKGHIYLKIENDRVAQIGWQIALVSYLDG
jgi:hypothetical protein